MSESKRKQKVLIISRPGEDLGALAALLRETVAEVLPKRDLDAEPDPEIAEGDEEEGR